MGTIEQEIEQWAKSTLPVYEFMDLGVVSVSEGALPVFCTSYEKYRQSHQHGSCRVPMGLSRNPGWAGRTHQTI